MQPDPWTLCVSPKHFDEHLQVIKRFSPRPCVTFDDGYADNFFNALPLLEKHDVQARFFVTSGAIGKGTEMWWDALDQLYTNVDSYLSQYWRVRLMPYGEQESEVERLFAGRKLSRTPRPGRRMLTTNELVGLSASPCVEIGAHTLTHPVLSALSPSQQRKEICQSKESLEALIGSEVRTFSYPNGTDADYTRETVELTRAAGFAHAYSAFEHPRSDPFQVPRVMIRDWDGDEFERVLVSRQKSAGL